MVFPYLDSPADFSVIARHEVPKQSHEREEYGLEIAALRSQ